MDKLNGVKINTRVKTYISAEDFTRIKDKLDNADGVSWTKTTGLKKGSEYLLVQEVEDMFSIVSTALDNLSTDQLKSYATHQVYIREGQDAHRNKLKAELGLGEIVLSKDTKNTIKYYTSKGYTLEQILTGQAKREDDERLELQKIDADEVGELTDAELDTLTTA